MNKIYVAGMGPGNRGQMTGEVKAVLEQAQVIIGYTVYIDLLRADYPDKEYLTTPMKQEEERCRLAFLEAGKGKRVVMVCSGDAGVYGMAGLMLELQAEYPDCEIEVLPGVTAAMAGGALLGAPLMHDFAVISLSDLLTPWAAIEKRILLAGEADFVLCLYNPSSRKRYDYLQKVCELLLPAAGPERICGIASCIGREGQSCRVLTLGELRQTQVDMFTTVFIGNSRTYEENGRMITPRGYRL